MRQRSSEPEARQRWRTFLKNHRDVIAGMDFFTVPMVTFQILYVFFVIHHARRRILHLNVTRNPSSTWISQQIREAFPFDIAPRYLIFDRDAKFADCVLRTIKAFGIEPVRTSFQSPCQNGVAERWVGSARRDLLNHVIVFNEFHLRRHLHSYVRHYDEDRSHLALSKDCLSPRETVRKLCPNARVVARPCVGGLHHRYEWRKAA